MRSWDIPSNPEELIDSDAGGIGDDAGTFAPMTLSVMKGIEYDGRKIPLAWQIDNEPESDKCEITNERISGMGIDADGYGWATLIDSVIRKYHPEIAGELNFGDTESASLVVWFESEAHCRKVAGSVDLDLRIVNPTESNWRMTMVIIGRSPDDNGC